MVGLQYPKRKAFFLLLLVTCLHKNLAKNNDVAPHHRALHNLLLPVSCPYPKELAHKNINTSKDWTIVVYIAAANDLKPFAARNIKQMASIGSNQHVNIVIHLDIIIQGGQKITRRYYLENNKIFYMNAEDSLSQKMDSGDPDTLISCCKWAIEDFPARNYALILWNHGTGCIDPHGVRIINPSELFVFNPAINKLELDRSIGFLDFMDSIDNSQRGMCWDDHTGNYLTNQKLEFALHTITSEFLHGQKLALLGFDACLMSMLEIANLAKKYAHYMVASQEVELGSGLNYEKALSPFLTGSPTPLALAQNIVFTYEKTYNTITDDFTHSALNLVYTDQLEHAVHNVASLLLECLKNQREGSVKKAIRASRNRLACTHFDEPSYVDLHHLLSNIKNNIKHFSLHAPNESSLKESLERAIGEAMGTIKTIVCANVAGKNLKFAQGLSIYFPENRMHPSYKKTNFAQTNCWHDLLNYYLQH